MKSKPKYILSIILITIGCWIIYATTIHPSLAFSLFIIISFINNPEKLKELNTPIIINPKKWNKKDFFEGASIILGIIIFIIIFAQIPEEKGKELLRKWYFIGTFWLLMFSLLSYKYFKNKENIATSGLPPTQE